MHNASFVEEFDQITEEKFSSIKIPNLFYMKIEQIPNFIENIAPSMKNPFWVMSHRGDMPVTEELFSAMEKNKYFVKWFGQNINCNENKKITSIPIGLENDFYNPQTQKRLKIEKNSKTSYLDKPQKICYMNFSFYTNMPSRHLAFLSLKDKEWTTNHCEQNVSKLDYDFWIGQVRNHHYVICPEGNGIDTHRMWETLYIGRIPIVLKCKNTAYYEDLPILQVNSWADLNLDLLLDSLNYFSNENNFNLQKLKFSYWKSTIENEIKNTKQLSI